jgi:hypothetical protein
MALAPGKKLGPYEIQSPLGFAQTFNPMFD